MTEFAHRPFKDIWVYDSEFYGADADIQRPICVVAKNVATGEVRRTWTEDKPSVPFPLTTPLFVAFAADAEIGTHLALGWNLPVNLLDLRLEFILRHNGLLEKGSVISLISVMRYYGLLTEDAAEAVEYKDMMRDRILQGPPYNDAEKAEILDYCQTDVEMTEQLLLKMYPWGPTGIDVEDRSLFLGRYAESVAYMNHNGIPIDHDLWKRLAENWEAMLEIIIAETDKEYGVYENSHFIERKFIEYLTRNNISWEIYGSLSNVKPRLDKDYFSERAQVYPQLNNLKELRKSIGKMRLTDLAVGTDGRNRAWLGPLGTITGRNAPKSGSFIFGMPKWMRSLIKPGPGRAVAYIDVEQEEYMIAAALSGDDRMEAAYNTGDPNEAMARMLGQMAPEIKKDSSDPKIVEKYKEIRKRFKRLTLAMNYSMGITAFAEGAGLTERDAREILRKHKRVYHKFWDFYQNSIDEGRLRGTMYTRLGWQWNSNAIGAKGDLESFRTLSNWKEQSHGADMMHYVSIMCMESGIRICAMIHDAALIESSAERIEEDVKLVQKYWEDAARLVIGKPVRSEVIIVKYPDRYVDEDGVAMWKTVLESLKKVEDARKAI
jgi:DNA polymerase I